MNNPSQSWRKAVEEKRPWTVKGHEAYIRAKIINRHILYGVMHNDQILARIRKYKGVRHLNRCKYYREIKPGEVVRIIHKILIYEGYIKK